MFGFATIAILLYFLYPVVLISLSIYSAHKKEVTAESYFFANRNTHWLTLGVSLLATSFFSPYIFGFASSGLSSGVPVAYAITSLIMLAVLGGFFAPRYLQMKIKTLPEFFERRFDRKCRRFLSTLYIVTNIAIRLLIILTVGRVFLGSVEGIDVFSSLLFFLVVTGIYVIIGGLQAEIHANLVQVIFIILVVAGFVAWLINQENGVDHVVHGIVSQLDLNSGGDSEFTRIGLLLGLPIVGFWFWCADQFMVQKILSAQNVASAKRASLTAGVLQIIPVLIFVLPLIVVPLSGRTDSAGFLRALFLNSSLPDSLRAGLIIGAVAAFMIPVANVFNSTSSLITFDFFCGFRPGASDRQIVLVGRMTIMVLVLISILLIPVSQTLDLDSCLQIFKIFSYFSSMIAAVFLMGLLNRKIGGASALFSLSAATFVILLRVVLQTILNSHQMDSGILNWFVKSAFLEFSVFVFLLSLALLFMFDYLKSRYELSLAKTRQGTAGMREILPALLAIAVIGVFLA